MDLAKSITASLGERYSDSFMPATIADAIDDSKREFTDSEHQATMTAMPYPITPQVEILLRIVKTSGGPAEFSRKYSRDDADKPIDATYISQILNGHRPFRDIARKNMAKRAGLPENFFETPQVTEHKASEPASVYKINSEVIDEAVEILSSMPVEWQRQALGAIKHIAHEYSETEQNSPKRASQ